MLSGYDAAMHIVSAHACRKVWTGFDSRPGIQGEKFTQLRQCSIFIVSFQRVTEKYKIADPYCIIVGSWIRLSIGVELLDPDTDPH
jgi:hypothetical protein